MAYTPVNIGDASSPRDGLPQSLSNARTLYYGSVLKAFDRKTMLTNLVTVKTITSGTGYDIPIIGQASDGDVKTHIPGTELQVNSIPVKQRHIMVDALHYFSMTIDKFDEAILNFDTREDLAKQAGEALAVKIEKDVAKTIVLASQTSGIIGGAQIQADGTEVNNDLIQTASTPKEKGDALIETVFTAVAILEQKDVVGEKYLVVSPIIYSYLAQSSAINKDITSGSNGGIDTGSVMSVAGIKIYKSNYIPTTPIDVNGTNKKLQALLFTKECVGVVKLLELTSEVNYLPTSLQDLLTTYYSHGMGVLKPGCSCVITGGNAQ